MMSFEYDTYMIRTFIVPLCFFVVIIPSCLFSAIKFFLKFKEHKKNIPIFIISLIIVICGTVIGSIQLSYGIRLVKFGDKEQVYTSGKIQEITDVPVSPKYWYDGNHNLYASWVKINSERYYIMTIGNFKVGDTVQIKYLNHSNFILSIDYINGESKNNLETDILIE